MPPGLSAARDDLPYSQTWRLRTFTPMMTTQYVHLATQHLAVINERVAPLDKLNLKPMKVPKAR
jgi:hypothetical protein